MTRELGFEFADILGLDFVRPSALWPHIEVYGRVCSATVRVELIRKLARSACHCTYLLGS
jgi:hypothetical protein